jgi:hypothetical protein
MLTIDSVRTQNSDERTQAFENFFKRVDYVVKPPEYFFREPDYDKAMAYYNFNEKCICNVEDAYV